MDTKSETKLLLAVAEAEKQSAEPQGVLVESSKSPGGATLINPYRTNKHSSTDIVALAAEIQKGNSYAQACVGSKLQVIAEQVRHLQAQARHVLEEAKLNTELNLVACNFVKVPGNTYHLYRRPSGQRYFSMICPVEWGNSCPHSYLGALRLESDYSWTTEKQLGARDSDQAIIDKILAFSKGPPAITQS